MTYSTVWAWINAHSLCRYLCCKCLSQGSPPAGNSHRLYTYSAFPHAMYITGLLQWFLIILQTFASLFCITSMVCPSSIPSVKFLLSCDSHIPAALQDSCAVWKMFVSQDNAPYAVFSMPQVRKAYNMSVHRHFISFWVVFQTLQFRLRKTLRVQEQIFSSPHYKDHQQTRTVIEDYLQKMQPKPHGR